MQNLQGAAADSVEQVVVHFYRFEFLEGLNGRGAESAGQNERVVHESITPSTSESEILVISLIVADAHASEVVRRVRGLENDVTHDVGMPSNRPALPISTNQLELAVIRILDPVVIDLIAGGTRLDHVTAQASMKIGVLEPEHRAGVESVVARHVDSVAPVSISTVRELAVLDGDRARIVVVTQHAVSGAIVNIDIAQGGGVGLMPHRCRVAALRCIAPQGVAFLRRQVELQVLQDEVVALELNHEYLPRDVDAGLDQRPTSGRIRGAIGDAGQTTTDRDGARRGPLHGESRRRRVRAVVNQHDIPRNDQILHVRECLVRAGRADVDDLTGGLLHGRARLCIQVARIHLAGRSEEERDRRGYLRTGCSQSIRHGIP